LELIKLILGDFNIVGNWFLDYYINNICI
jgi:hypothetical protein